MKLKVTILILVTWSIAQGQAVFQSFGNVFNIFRINDITVYNNRLYFGGNFTELNYTSASDLAWYDGNKIVDVPGFGGDATHMVVYKNKLIIASSPVSNVYTTVESWNDTVLSDLAFNTNSIITEMLVVDDTLYAVGDIRFNNAQYAVAKYDGAKWAYDGLLGAGKKTNAIAALKDTLFIGGNMSTVDGIALTNYRVAGYHRGYWFRLENTGGPMSSPLHEVLSMATRDDKLVLGNYSSVNGYQVSEWNKAQWSTTTYPEFSHAGYVQVFNASNLLIFCIHGPTNTTTTQNASQLFIETNNGLVQLSDSLHRYAGLNYPDVVAKGIQEFNGEWFLFGKASQTGVNRNDLAAASRIIGVLDDDAALPTTSLASYVFPNPCSNNLTIENAEWVETFEILDVFGRPVLSGKTPNNINVSHLPAGVYFLQLKSLSLIKTIQISKR